MSMVAGSVDRTTIDPGTGAASSSSGFAGVVYAWMVSYFAGLAVPQPPAAPALGSTANPFSVARPCQASDITTFNAARLSQFQFWADLANMTAQAITYIQGNAHAHVTSQQLGNVPASTVHGTPIDPPSSAVDIPIA